MLSPSAVTLQRPQASPDLTVTAKRGTLQEAIVFSGQVVPARTSQLSFRSSGTVRAVYVRSGQAVHKGAPLVELTLDEPALRAAQTQATVAELAYQSQQARVEALTQGGGVAALEDARAAVARARAGVLEAELARELTGASPASLDVQLARLALEQANDELANIQAAAQRNRQASASTSAVALRSAERKVTEATIRLELLRAARSSAAAARDTERQRAHLELDQAKEALARAQLAARRAQEDARTAPEAAAAAVRAAERQVTAAALKFESLQDNQRVSTNNREAQRQLARMELSEAQAQLGRAQAALRRAQGDAQTRSPGGAEVSAHVPSPDRQVQSDTRLVPAPTPAPTPTSDSISAAVADLRAVERRVVEAAMKVEALDRSPEENERAAASRDTERQLAQMQLEAANEELAQARVAAQRATEDAQAASAAAALAVRAAERRVADATLQLEQLSAGGEATRDAEVRLAELALAQANDELLQVQAMIEVTARQEQEVAEAASSTTAFAIRAAERKLAEASLRFEQARAIEQSTQLSQARRDTQHELPDLQVAAAKAALAAAEARFAELQSGSVSAQALRNEQQRASLLFNDLLEARSAAQPVVVLIAPFDGTVTSVDVGVGQNVEPRATVVRIDDPGRLSIAGAVAESDVSRLALDQPVEVAFPGVTDAVAAGSITDISGAAIRQADRVRFPVRVDVREVPVDIRVGMTASVTFTARRADNAVHIPTSAVRRTGSLATVTKVSADGQRQEVPVVVGDTFGTDTQIVSGVEEGDVVTIHPQASAPPVPGTLQQEFLGGRLR